MHLWPKVRYAKIDKKVREAFEKTGRDIVTSTLAGNYPPAVGPLKPMGFSEQDIKKAASEWLLELSDVERRHKQWLLWLAIATFVCVVAGLVFQIAGLRH